MKSSIRQFLIISLITSIIVLWIVTIFANAAVNKRDISNDLDGQIVYTNQLISALTQATHPTKAQFEINKIAIHPYLIQVINKNGQIILRSEGAPETRLNTIPAGFETLNLEGQRWRSYTSTNKKTGDQYIIAAPIASMEAFAFTILENNIIVMAFGMIVLASLIWLITQFSLRYIKQLSNELTNRAASHLEPIETYNTPLEFQSLVAEMNNLFIQIRQAQEHNKRFASDAAHELRTPLAALKTQAQVALNSKDDAERQASLKNVIKGVDRSTHLVEQLLTLGRLGPGATLNDIVDIDVEKLAAEMIALLVPSALNKNIEIELIAKEHNQTIIGNEISIAILMRNLVDNAIRYTPEGGFVKVYILPNEKSIVFRVQDSGPGIAPEMHGRIFERFFRVLGTQQTGSGLGLAIVKQIADLHRATISLSIPAAGHGLQVDVIFVRDQH